MGMGPPPDRPGYSALGGHSGRGASCGCTKGFLLEAESLTDRCVPPPCGNERPGIPRASRQSQEGRRGSLSVCLPGRHPGEAEPRGVSPPGYPAAHDATVRRGLGAGVRRFCRTGRSTHPGGGCSRCGGRGPPLAAHSRRRRRDSARRFRRWGATRGCTPPARQRQRADTRDLWDVRRRRRGVGPGRTFQPGRRSRGPASCPADQRGGSTASAASLPVGVLGSVGPRRRSRGARSRTRTFCPTFRPCCLRRLPPM